MWIIKVVDSTATNTWWLGSSTKRLTEGYVHGLLSGDIELHSELDVFTKQYSTPDVTLEFTNAPYRVVAGTSNYRSRLSDEWFSIKNATVTIYQDLGGATAIADCLQCFKGYAPFGASVDGGRITLRVVASTLRNIPTTVPSTQIIDIDPDAPEETRDNYLPVLFGDFVWTTRGEEGSRKNNALVECIPINKSSKPTFAIADHAVTTPTKLYTKIDDELFEITLTDFTYTASDSNYLSKPTLTPIAGLIKPFLEYPLEVVHPREFMSETAWNNSALGLVNSIDPQNKLPATGYLATDYSIDTQTLVYDSYDDGSDQYGLAYCRPLKSLAHPQFGNPSEWGILLYVGSDIHATRESIRVTWNVVRGVTRPGPVVHYGLLYDDSFTINTLVASNNAWTEATFYEYQNWAEVSNGIVAPYGEPTYNYSDAGQILELTFRRWRGAIKNGVKGDTSVGGVYEARFACKYQVPAIENLWIACGGKKFGSWIDEGGRSNSFNAGDAIRSPMYVIESLLRDYAGLVSDQIDMASFDSNNSDTGGNVTLHTKQQQINFVINEPKPVSDLIKEILEQTWVAMVETPFGKLKLINLWNQNPTITRTIPVSHIIDAGIKLSRSTFNIPQISVDVAAETPEITRPRTAGDTWTRKMKFIKEGGTTASDTANDWSGEWPHLTNESAINYADFLMGSKQQGTQGFWSTEHVIIEFETVGGTNADLQIGDFISIDAGMDYILKCYGQSWSGRAFMVTAITNLLDRTRLKCIELYSRFIPSSGGAVVAWTATEGMKIPTTDGASVAWSATEGTRPFSVDEDAEFRVLSVLTSGIYCGVERPSE